MTEPKPYFLFTRTPLHVGAGQSVGYVDLPIQREPHTRIPIVPGSSLKGVLRDLFPGDDPASKETRYWLFGHDTEEKEQSKYQAGALLIGEARVLCFPVRSAKGSFAWITCPLALARYARDGKPQNGQRQPLPTTFDGLTETPNADGRVTVLAGAEVALARSEGTHQVREVVLEEYTYLAQFTDALTQWENHLKDLPSLAGDPVWRLLPGRLVIVPDGIFSFYVQSACEIAQHVAINDDTGTAQDKALFNQENCPAETLFHGVMSAQKINGKPAEGENGALSKLASLNGKPLQIGGGETTGLGWCSFIFNPTQNQPQQ
jgi:CRISPR-associated protein Cmr4